MRTGRAVAFFTFRSQEEPLTIASREGGTYPTARLCGWYSATVSPASSAALYRVVLTWQTPPPTPVTYSPSRMTGAAR